MPKDRKGQPVFDDSQEHGLNEDPQETHVEKLIRTSAKKERARMRDEQDPEKYWDAEELSPAPSPAWRSPPGLSSQMPSVAARS